MADQPKYEPLEAADFFADNRASRPRVENTIARGHLNADTVFFTGKTAQGAFTDRVPMPLTQAQLQRGRERFDIYCAVCHSRLGDGDGMVVRRGFFRPPSFHSERFRDYPAGRYFSVMTQGFGAMPGYAAQVPVPDRWAIVGYIRALRLSQNARLDSLPEATRQKLLLENSKP